MMFWGLWVLKFGPIQDSGDVSNHSSPRTNPNPAPTQNPNPNPGEASVSPETSIGREIFS